MYLKILRKNFNEGIQRKTEFISYDQILRSLKIINHDRSSIINIDQLLVVLPLLSRNGRNRFGQGSFIQGETRKRFVQGCTFDLHPTRSSRPRRRYTSKDCVGSYDIQWICKSSLLCLQSKIVLKRKYILCQ